jgi:5-deoxy-5-amino-3-dehydroquinate synthase
MTKSQERHTVELVFPSGRTTVVVGRGAARDWRSLIPDAATGVFVITQAGVPSLADLEGLPIIEVPSEEASAKTLATVEKLVSRLLELGADRGSVLVAHGGGVVTDLVGFTASVFMRGVAYLSIATTWTAQIDAAIGGKTGVNLSSGEKNIIGAFWHPVAVVDDVDYLELLPDEETVNGKGELVKYSLLGVRDALDPDPVKAVIACVRYKARIVARDEREQTGLRAILNYGHTVGHAIEAATSRRGRKVPHGAAVGMGLVAECEIAYALQRISSERRRLHHELVASAGLPTKLPSDINAEELVAYMARDKKHVGAKDSLTLALDGPKGVELVREVPLEVVAGALRRLTQEGSGLSR